MLDYLEANDSMLMGIMMRFRTLSATNQSLVQMLLDTSDQVYEVLCSTYFQSGLNSLPYKSEGGVGGGGR